MNVAQRKLIMNVFNLSQFGYCPLVRMFHSWNLNKRINNKQEGALKIVFRDYEVTFQQLLKSVSIHHRNLHVLATKIFKTKNSLNPVINYFLLLLFYFFVLLLYLFFCLLLLLLFFLSLLFFFFFFF